MKNRLYRGAAVTALTIFAIGAVAAPASASTTDTSDSSLVNGPIVEGPLVDIENLIFLGNVRGDS